MLNAVVTNPGASTQTRPLRSRLLRQAASLGLGLLLLAGIAACAEAAEEPIINSGSGDIWLTPTPEAG